MINAFAGENRILLQLSPADRSSLQPHLKPFALVQGTVLHANDTEITQVYFPVAGMVSLLAGTKSGQQIETGIIGREGVVGGSIGNYGTLPFGEATVQIAGSALRIKSASFLQLFGASDAFRRAINGFQSIILLQAQQSAACHALHQVEARLCRWLLQSRDVIGSDTIPLTQEFLSHMLGVQRSAVSLSASALLDDGVIEYSRGTIRILDEAGLKRRACECYEIIRAHVEKLGAAT